MITKIIFILVANILFLYLFWRRLKEDYSGDQVFTTAVYIIIALIVSQVLSSQFFPEWWFWLGCLFVGGATLIGIRRFHMRYVETLEATVIALIPVFTGVFLYNFIQSKDWLDLSVVIFLSLLLVGFFILDKHYKKISWYRSGRIGFSGLSVAGIFFLARAVVATRFTDMLSFSGRYETILSAVSAFFVFLGIFTLARQKT